MGYQYGYKLVDDAPAQAGTAEDRRLEAETKAAREQAAARVVRARLGDEARDVLEMLGLGVDS